MKALLKNHRQSPRKTRLVVDLIRGKGVEEARASLAFLPKKSAPEIAKLLDSAVANAREMGAKPEDLFVKTVTVDKGTVMRRGRPFGRGRSGVIRKTLSIVKLELGTRAIAKPARAAKSARKSAKSARPEKVATK